MQPPGRQTSGTCHRDSGIQGLPGLILRCVTGPPLPITVRVHSTRNTPVQGLPGLYILGRARGGHLACFPFHPFGKVGPRFGNYQEAGRRRRTNGRCSSYWPSYTGQRPPVAPGRRPVALRLRPEGCASGLRPM
eukprot:921455-Pyramimonas_sp.AAC.2